MPTCCRSCRLLSVRPQSNRIWWITLAGSVTQFSAGTFDMTLQWLDRHIGYSFARFEMLIIERSFQ
jgi:hypothetical protein